MRRRRDPDPEFSWRQGLLRQAGLAPEAARAVAGDERYDLHEILALLERGCPPHLALEIAAPLEDRRIP
ncbi:MAG: hypothetical protein JWO69_269 [Thermoleophilia bacterium]|jgi:hypothetical protein|nr:hypothetical protein [Thermoleophilia bacterium]